jgi:hypothetical protein
MFLHRLFTCLLGVEVAALAQQTTGDLQIRVMDSLGLPIAGVNVVASGVNVQGIRGGASDDAGSCTILGLPPGKITVRLSHANYQLLSFQEVLIALGKTTSLGEIRLQQRVHDMPELIISAQRPVIDPTSTVYGANLRASDFENLPVERNYRSMTSLLPQANASYFGDEVNIGGATGFENKYFVDGVEVTDPLIGAISTNLPYNFVKEIEVKAGGYEAESRSTLGGLINVVTHSGTNEFHGSVFGFYTSNRFVASRRVGLLNDPSQGDFSDYDVGFGLGGPIVPDQLWFYAAYNPTFTRHDVSVPGFGVSVDRTLRHLFAAKVTWSASQELGFVLTATGDPTVRKAVGRNVLVPPSALTNPDPYLQSIGEGGANLSLKGTYLAADNLLLETSIARVIRHDTGDPSTGRGAELFFNDNVTRTWSGGVGGWWNSYRQSTMANIAGKILAGSSSLKVGLDFRVNSTDNQYQYHNVIKYSDTLYSEGIGRGYQTVQHRIPSVYGQGTWQVFDRLSIHGGIRWEGQYVVGSNGNVVQKVMVPLQPRVGITYSPGDDGTQKVFGSFGRFSQELGLFLSTWYHSDQGYDYTIEYPQDPRISRAGADTLALGGPHIIYPEVGDLGGQYFDEFSLGYERSLFGSLRASIQGVYRTLREAIEDAFVLSEFRFRFGNPGKGLLADYPRPERNYRALIVTIEQHDDEHFNFLASYVLSRDHGNYEGLFDAFLHSQFPNQNWSFDNPRVAMINTSGLVPNDRTHVFKFSGSYRFAFGLTTGLSFVAQSGTPLSEYANRPVGIRFLVPRGSAGRTPALWDFSARVVYELPFIGLDHARLIMDVFHIASQRKPVDIDQQHYFNVDANGVPSNPNPTYGQAYRYQPPMSVRVGMEVNF